MKRGAIFGFILLFRVCDVSYSYSVSRRRLLGTGFLASCGCLRIQPAKAACLSGDTRKECIGVYKVPMDDRIKAYVESPEQLKKFAPELKFVEAQKPPETSAKALEVLLAQRLAADDIKQVVLEGKLEEAGIKLLNLIPKVTLACRIVQAESMSEAQELFLERKVSLVLGLYGETDVMIGQGIRGELGASAPAQINIIKQLTESNEAFDELLAMVRSQLGK